MSKMINVSIVGAGGYTGGELIRILQHHPKVQLGNIQSKSQAGRKIAEHHAGIANPKRTFDTEPDFHADLIFLCGGHGKSQLFLQQNPQARETRIIDLSSDFRQPGPHSFVYGLPEQNRSEISSSNHIANPGCFATAIQLALLPLALHKLCPDDIHIHAITGSTGAGQALADTTHFSWRNNNISLYKVFDHQHELEIKQGLTEAANGSIGTIFFVPMRGNFTRGIFVSAYTNCDVKEQEVVDIFQAYYSTHPFTRVIDNTVHLKMVIGTNLCVIQPRITKGQVHVSVALDNLLKGASGQAVQNMNLMFGWEESLGLNLHAISF